MVKINHITINTRHNRVSTPSDISKDLIFVMKDLVKDAQREEGVKLFDNTVFKLSMEEECYAGTLFTYISGQEIPILSTSGTKSEDKRDYVWNNIEELYKKLYKDNNVKMLPASTPLILDCLLPASASNPEAFKWTGDFTKCLGWVIMYPQEIVNQ